MGREDVRVEVLGAARAVADEELDGVSTRDPHRRRRAVRVWRRRGGRDLDVGGVVAGGELNVQLVVLNRLRVLSRWEVDLNAGHAGPQRLVDLRR